jgi:hypothetical protein
MLDMYSVVDGQLKFAYDETTGKEDESFVRGYERSLEGENVAIKGITSKEATKLKRVYERLQGGYRSEEKTIIEMTLLGEIFLQFRKYLPSLLKNMFGSVKNDYSLGRYVTKEVIDGNMNKIELQE